jgi:hypothetical protein
MSTGGWIQLDSAPSEWTGGYYNQPYWGVDTVVVYGRHPPIGCGAQLYSKLQKEKKEDEMFFSH